MKTIDLDGKITDWKITGNVFNHGENVSKSSLHMLCRELLKEVYPTVPILEEVPINPLRGKTLYLDFYIKLLNLAIEVNGEQHYKFTPHFHKTPASFVLYKQNEQMKKDWCTKNGIKLIELPYNETKDDWRKKITC